MRRLGMMLIGCAGLTLATACPNGGDEDPGPTAAETFKAALQGSWYECKVDGGSSNLDTLTFSGLNLTVDSIAFSDPTCTTPVSTSSHGGTYAIGSAVTAGFGATTVTALQIDITAGPETSHDIGFVDTNATPDRLYFGDKSGGKDGATPALRPTELETVRFLSKL